MEGKRDKFFKGILFLAAIGLLIVGTILASLNRTKPAAIIFTAAVLCLIFVFLDKLESFEIFGAKVKTRKEIEEGITLAKRETQDLSLIQEEQKFKQAAIYAGTTPRRTIDYAWDELERSATDSLKISFATSPEDVAVKLKNSNLLPEDKNRLFEELLSLRNKLIHNDRIVLSSSTAIDYAEAAYKLAEYIRIHNQDKVSVNEELNVDISEGSA